MIAMQGVIVLRRMLWTLMIDGSTLTMSKSQSIPNSAAVNSKTL